MMDNWIVDMINLFSFDYIFVCKNYKTSKYNLNFLIVLISGITSLSISVLFLTIKDILLIVSNVDISDTFLCIMWDSSSIYTFKSSTINMSPLSAKVDVSEFFLFIYSILHF